MRSKVVAILGAVAAAVMIAAGASAEPSPSQTPPPADQGPQHIRQLVTQLGDKDYFTRQRAETELAKLGFDAFDALSEATISNDPEIAARAHYLLRMMKVEWVRPDDPPQVRQLLGDYDALDFEARQARMQRLASLSKRAGIAALCRLVRYEKSALLSKRAALELLGAVRGGADLDQQIVDAVHKVLGDSHRAGAQWLFAYARSGADPAAAGPAWNKLVDAEETVLKTAPDQTATEIVVALVRFQASRLKKIGRNEEAIAALRRLLQLEKGDPDTLVELVQWSIDQKAWQAVDELAERFAPLIAGNAALTYAMAEAQQARGNKDRAEEMAAKAWKLDPGENEEALASHYMRALGLQERGLFAWARREYRRVMAAGGGPNQRMVTFTAVRLAEMEHDQGDDLAAAETMQSALKSPAGSFGNSSALRAQMDYFFACHWKGKGDKAKARQFLETALAENPADIEVLIACYQLPGQTPEFHEKIQGLVRSEVDSVRELIEQSPDLPSNYNQLAWLVANTEGDLDEALRQSQRSLELLTLTANPGGYYDTLGRVYFAKGDYENAVAYQTKAAELEPHMGLIKRQLELFRKKLEEKKLEEKKQKK